MTVIYCDYAASTPLDPKVKQAMEENAVLGNPSSDHVYGLRARQQVEQAKKAMGRLINAKEPSDIVLTSGATESINMVLKGVALQAILQGDASPHIVTSAIEHKATLDTCKQLHAFKCKITKIPVDKQGSLDMSALKEVLKEKPLLFSLMHVNSEIGSVQPIEAVADLLRDNGCLFHVDAAQSMGKLPLDVTALSLDYLSFSSHKMYGPQGIGGLYVKPSAQRYLQPLISGGGHQQGLRSGTIPVSLAVGFGVACEQAQQHWQEDWKKVGAYRKQVMSKLQDLEGIDILGEETANYPGILSVCIEGVHGDMLAGLLQEQVAFSVGSACTAHFREPSHVLQAMGVNEGCLSSTIRLSFGRFSRLNEMERLGAILCEGINKLRNHSPNILSSAPNTSHRGLTAGSRTYLVTLKRGNVALRLECDVTKGKTIEKCTIHVFSVYAGWRLKVFLENYLKNKPMAILKEITTDFLMEKTDLSDKDFEIALLFEESLRQLWQQWEMNNE